MVRQIPAKLGIATLAVLTLTDFQLYLHRYHKPTEMLGMYLRQHINKDCRRLEPAGTCLQDTSGTYFKAPQRKPAPDRVFRT